MNFTISDAWKILSQTLIGWLESFIQSLPNLVVAFALLSLFFIIARIVRSTLERVTDRFVESRAVASLFYTLAYYGIIFIGIFTALGVLKLDKTVTSLLAGAGVIGLAIGFAFQEIAANFFSGILIAISKPYRVGDLVDADSHLGRISRITLRTTSLVTFQGLEVLIPNKDMFTKPIVNLTSTPDRRLDITVGVSYGEELRRIEDIVKNALEDVTARLKNHPIEFFYTEFADSSINFEARVWIDYSKGHISFLQARHEAIMNIKEAFDANDITIPFPIRTLDFGIKGGETLAANLGQSSKVEVRV